MAGGNTMQLFHTPVAALAQHSAMGLSCAVLRMFVQMVVKAQVSNYLVVAIDTQLRDDLTAKGYNVYYRDITVSCTSA